MWTGYFHFSVSNLVEVAEVGTVENLKTATTTTTADIQTVIKVSIAGSTATGHLRQGSSFCQSWTAAASPSPDKSSFLRRSNPSSPRPFAGIF